MLMASKRLRYLAYMLRLWQVGEDQTVWRASLENAHSGDRQGFASLHALVAFLAEETAQDRPDAAEESCPDSKQSQREASESHLDP
jgi:type II secretory pathway component HofQ